MAILEDVDVEDILEGQRVAIVGTCSDYDAASADLMDAIARVGNFHQVNDGRCNILFFQGPGLDDQWDLLGNQLVVVDRASADRLIHYPFFRDAASIYVHNYEVADLDADYCMTEIGAVDFLLNYEVECVYLTGLDLGTGLLGPSDIDAHRRWLIKALADDDRFGVDANIQKMLYP